MAWQRAGPRDRGSTAPKRSPTRLEAAGALSTELADADAGTPAERALFGEPGAEARRCGRAAGSTALFAEQARRFRRASMPPWRGVRRGPVGGGVVRKARGCRLGRAHAARSSSRSASRERLWIVPTWHMPPRPGRGERDPRSRARVRHRQPSDHAPVPRLARAPRAARRSSPRLRMRVRDPRHRRAHAWRGRGVGRGRRPARAAGRALQCPAQRRAARLLDAQSEVPGRARVTVANILANPLRMLAPILANHTQPGGAIALCGILEEQAPR